MQQKSFFTLKAFAFMGMMALALSSCLKDDDNDPNQPNNGEARARIEITDAAIDDPNVQGVFITVVDVKIDGKSWAGFDGKTTFDLLAYQKGETKLLGEGELAADSYSEIILVLDTDTDANGDSPGAYVKDASGTKRKLDGGNEMIIKAKGSFATKADETTNAVIDMDLRKSIVYQSGSTTEFEFVTDPELFAAVRLMDKANTGSIEGDITDGVSGSDKIVVYAYKTGEFDTNEKFEQGASQIQFQNAVTSAVVAENGTFKLAFLPSGNHELHFISYKENNQGKLEAKGELQMNIVGPTLDLLQLGVTSKQNISLDLVVTGILFF